MSHNAPDDLFEFPVVALLGGFTEGAVPPPPGDGRQNYRKGKQHTDHTDNDHDDHACLSAESERDEGISRITRQPVCRGFSIHTIRRTTSAKSRFSQPGLWPVVTEVEFVARYDPHQSECVVKAKRPTYEAVKATIIPESARLRR